MAKKNKYDKKHQANLTHYQREVDLIYEQAIERAAQLGVSLHDFKHDKPFRWGDYPLTEKKAEQLVEWLQQGLMETIEQGVTSEWALSNLKNSAMSTDLLGGAEVVQSLPKAMQDAINGSTTAAEKAFLQRKVKGLDLSDRVWRYTEQFKQEMELSIELGIRTGRSAADISRDIRIFLQEPARLFRRINMASDEDKAKGIKDFMLSKAAKAYHSGQGVYRSSARNAMRLAVTETNMAYRTADHERWQKMDFVLGQHVVLSNNHTCKGVKGVFIDICDELSGKNYEDQRGRYPKNFKFTGWHPFCRCAVVPILATKQQVGEYLKAKREGREYTFDGKVTDMPDELNAWVGNNTARIARAKSLPYFIRDNKDLIQHAQLSFNAQKGAMADGKFVSFPAGKEIEPTLITTFFAKVAKEFPELAQGGIRNIEFVKGGTDGFMACAKHPEGGFVFKIANYNFYQGQRRGKPVYYNPAKSLNDALKKIQAGQRLSFKEEYAIEGVWHEFNHASAKGWEKILVGKEKHDENQSMLMEACNQLVARHTYPAMLQRLGMNARHYDSILSDGYGYNREVSNLRWLLRQAKIDEDETVSFLKETFAKTYYEKLEKAIVEFFAEKGTPAAGNLLMKIRDAPDTYRAYLMAMGVK